MTTPDPRTEVRDMIADKLRYCPTGLFNITAMADWLMDLFPDVWEHHAASGPCYVLRTAPTGQTCRHCGDALADMRQRVIALHREEITAAGRVVDAARAWRDGRRDRVDGWIYHQQCRDLYAAVDAFDAPARTGPLYCGAVGEHIDNPAPTKEARHG